MKSLKKKHWNFIINGTAGVGKDEFVKIFTFIFKDHKNVIINNISTVEYIKILAIDSFGWNGIKDEKGRRLLSDLLDADVRYQDGPFKRTISNIIRFEKRNFDKHIINFIHSREPKQIKKYKDELKNSHTILIRRLLKNSYSNHADKNVENYDYNTIIENKGTINDYKKLVHSFIESVLLK
jgi:hypothetical protein